MAELEDIKRTVPRISDEQARALADWYASVAGNVRRFPAPDLKAVEPPLRSVAAPRKP